MQEAPPLKNAIAFAIRIPGRHSLIVTFRCLQARQVFVKGHLADLAQLGCYRVSLAPLRFGAGLKVRIGAWL